MAVFCFLVWYYPVGFYRNAEWTDSVNIRAFHTLMVIVSAFLYSSSLAHMIVAGMPNEETAGAVATLASIMLYAFCGILVGPTGLPRFWIFMYRVSCNMHWLKQACINLISGEPVYISCVELHVINTGPSSGLLRQYRVPDLFLTSSSGLWGVHARLHLNSGGLPSRCWGYRPV